LRRPSHLFRTEPNRAGLIHAILTRGRGRIDDALMARCPELRVVARCGVGLDNIDLLAAKRRGVTVIYAPGSTTSAVAEHTLMLMLAGARRLRQTAAAVHAGNWAVRDGYGSIDMRLKTMQPDFPLGADLVDAAVEDARQLRPGQQVTVSCRNVAGAGNDRWLQQCAIQQTGNTAPSAPPAAPTAPAPPSTK